MKKKGQADNFLKIILAVAGIAVVLVAIGAPVKQWFAAITGVEEPVIEEFCGIEDITMKISDYALGAFGTDPSLTSAVFVDLNGDGIRDPVEDIGDIADDGSTTVPVNVYYWVYGGWNGGTGGTYYVQELTGNTNCRDPLQINTELPTIDTSVTFVVTNDDGTLNSATDLSLDADEETSITVEVKTTAKQYYGNPALGKCNVLVIEYNRTAFDSFNPVGAIIGGVAGTPKTHTTAGTSNTTASWYMGPISSIPQEFTIDIDSATGDPNTGTGNFRLDIYDCDYDFDADENTIIKAVEDEDGNDLGSATDQTNIVNVS